MKTTRRTRPPTTPGEILREEFLEPMGMTQKQLADHLRCDVKVVNRIVNGRSSVTADMALRLGAAFGLGGLYALYEERIEGFRTTPPDPGWDGVYVATTK